MKNSMPVFHSIQQKTEWFQRQFFKSNYGKYFEGWIRWKKGFTWFSVAGSGRSGVYEKLQF